MNPETIKAIQQSLEPIAQKIGEGAKFVYEVYYRQTLVEGYLQIIIPVLICIGLIFLTKSWRKFALKKALHCDGYIRDNWIGARWIAPTVVWVIFSVVSLISITEGAMKAANPHYYTIDRIMTSVTGKDIIK